MSFLSFTEATMNCIMHRHSTTLRCELLSSAEAVSADTYIHSKYFTERFS